MLAIVRLILIALFFIVSTPVFILFCLVRPFHRNNVCAIANIYGKMHKVLGVELEIRRHPSINIDEQYVYIGNHQSNYDLFTISSGVLPNTVSIGKKSLKWVPFFGWIYWLSGNILIDRKNTAKAANTIANTAEKIKSTKLSVWMFPEGTRSYGRGLLPFKTGAFRTAVQAGVPIVPACMTTTDHIKLNRWNNGKVIIELMAPILIDEAVKDNVRGVTNSTHELMKAKIAELDAETGNAEL